MTAGSESPWPSFASSACASNEYGKQLDEETLWCVRECVKLTTSEPQPVLTAATRYHQICVYGTQRSA